MGFWSRTGEVVRRPQSLISLVISLDGRSMGAWQAQDWIQADGHGGWSDGFPEKIEIQKHRNPGWPECMPQSHCEKFLLPLWCILIFFFLLLKEEWKKKKDFMIWHRSLIIVLYFKYLPAVFLCQVYKRYNHCFHKILEYWVVICPWAPIMLNITPSMIEATHGP